MCTLEIRDLHKEILFDFRNSGGIDNQSKDRDEKQNDLKVKVLKFLRAFIVCFFRQGKRRKGNIVQGLNQKQDLGQDPLLVPGLESIKQGIPINHSN